MKVGNGEGASEVDDMNMTQAPMPPMNQDPNMGGGMPPMGDQMDPMGGGMPQDNGQMDPMGGGMPQDNSQSQYDTDFDAGVEADEDTDPKKYIQQLTGKLSTTLNSYNSENADDEGLNKYVAKMIVKASTKNMNEPQKKEIIKAINTSSNEEPVEDEEPQEEPMEQPKDMEQPPMDQEQPLMEHFTKKGLVQFFK